jgi:hypothetical protein
MAPGNLFSDNYASAMTNLLSTFAEFNPEHDDSTISQVVDMAALRAEVWRRLAQRVEVMHAFLEAGRGEGSGEHLRDHWRELTPDIFVAASIVTIGTGNQQRRSEPEVRKQLETIGRLQASVWVAICLTWGRVPPSNGSFEDDLISYIDRETIYPFWIPKFCARADKFCAEKPGETLTIYCMEAIRATLYSYLEETNPRAREWTRQLVSFEMEMRNSAACDKPVLKQLQISQERASYRRILVTA